jgi:L-asparaginase II
MTALLNKPLISMPFISDAPLRILVNRNHSIESVHEVDIALCDADGQVIFGMGAIEAPIFPRSAMKPLQALALIEYLNEAADSYPALSLAEKALICASHNGETFHSEGVKLLLQKFNISPDALICGAHWSLDQTSLIDQVRSMDSPEKTHNNCSGKHAGMLILAQLLTGSPEGYADIAHQAQQRILGVLEMMTGSDLTSFANGIDGCGAPVYSAPLGNWARAFALFAGGGLLPIARETACADLTKAIAANPLYIAGHNRACSAINHVYGEAITVKVGAEGVYSAAFHELGLGLMLKTRDGNKRGAEVALGAVIRALGYNMPEELAPYFTPLLHNWAGTEVGDITLGNLTL